MEVRLTQALRQQIFEQMQRSYPNEGGGFLLGQQTAQAMTIEDVIAVENTFAAEEQYHRYAMQPQDWLRLEDQAEARGLSLVGYYHSHPDSPAVPSEYDREYALPNFTYVITSVHAGPRAVEQRAWNLRPDRSAFDELLLVIS